MRWPWQKPARTGWRTVVWQTPSVGQRIRRAARFFHVLHNSKPDTLHITPDDLYELLCEIEYVPCRDRKSSDGYDRYYGLRIVEASPIAPTSTTYVGLELGDLAIYDWREEVL